METKTSTKLVSLNTNRKKRRKKDFEHSNQQQKSFQIAFDLRIESYLYCSPQIGLWTNRIWISAHSILSLYTPDGFCIARVTSPWIIGYKWSWSDNCSSRPPTGGNWWICCDGTALEQWNSIWIKQQSSLSARAEKYLGKWYRSKLSSVYNRAFKTFQSGWHFQIHPHSTPTQPFWWSQPGTRSGQTLFYDVVIDIFLEGLLVTEDAIEQFNAAYKANLARVFGEH